LANVDELRPEARLDLPSEQATATNKGVESAQRVNTEFWPGVGGHTFYAVQTDRVVNTLTCLTTRRLQ
jgi:hypothetical protein